MHAVPGCREEAESRVSELTCHGLDQTIDQIQRAGLRDNAPATAPDGMGAVGARSQGSRVDNPRGVDMAGYSMPMRPRRQA